VLTSALASSAWAGGANAAAGAVARAALDLGEEPQLVLVFGDPGLPPGEVVAQAAMAAPSAHVAGMTSDALLTLDGVRWGGCSALAFGAGVGTGVGIACHASRDLREAGRAAAAEALHGLDPEPGQAVLLLLVDPTSGDEADAIAGAYSVAGAHVPLAGGGADGDAARLFADGEHRADAVVAVAIASPRPVAVGTAHGCRVRTAPAIATRTRGRELLELDGRPAEEVYLEALGLTGRIVDDERFEALAVLHPLAQHELRGELRVRHVQGRAGHGGLACATPIPTNAAVWFTDQTRGSIVRSAAEAAETVVEALGGPPRAAVVFDCAARRRALAALLEQEAEALTGALEGAGALAGLYTRGEVGRTHGAKGDRNHAVVVVGFA
jgi:hypothetical protein